MLGIYPVDVVLLATHLDVARRFYGEELGLPVLLEDEQFVTFGCGGDNRHDSRRRRRQRRLERLRTRRQDAMTEHKVVGRKEWEAARDEVLPREKDHTLRGDQLLPYHSMCRPHGAVRRLFR